MTYGMFLQYPIRLLKKVPHPRLAIRPMAVDFGSKKNPCFSTIIMLEAVQAGNIIQMHFVPVWRDCQCIM